VAAKSPADGYTLLLGSPGSLTINPALLPRMNYDSLRDFAPITLATISAFTLVVHPSLPAKSVKELVALARRSRDSSTTDREGTARSRISPSSSSRLSPA
jgi:tripartite-type tricarboxylate transporter receptor subunit TctC